MAAAALAGRLRRRRTGAAARATSGEAVLCFDALGGPLVVVSGLVGGAGATTLAYLLARSAARHGSAPVLLAELHQQAGLASLAGAGSTLALCELAQAVAEDRQVERPFAELDGGLRLVGSTRPASGEPVAVAALAQLLAQAREAHGLVVLDTGPPAWAESDALLRAADHVLFVLPATVAALRRVELLGAGGLLTRAAETPATLVAIATRPGRGAPVKQLRWLAERHADRLLLVPYFAELADGRQGQCDLLFEDTMAALATVLRRAP